jgi:voltage-gated potassium channel
MGRGKDQRHLRDLVGSRRWRTAGTSVLRGTGLLALTFLVYATLPVDGFDAADPSAAWVRLVAVVLAFLGLWGLQVRLVLSSRVPKVRAAEAVVVSLVSFLCLFALLHLSLATTDPSAFTEPLGRIDALYFTVTTFATVGFGDIVPVTRLARTLVMVQMLLSLGLLVMIAKVTFYVADEGLRQRD